MAMQATSEELNGFLPWQRQPSKAPQMGHGGDQTMLIPEKGPGARPMVPNNPMAERMWEV